MAAPLIPDFGRTATDYRRFRAGFPPELITRLRQRGIVTGATDALDLGTGTGTLARLLAPVVASVVALDPAVPMLEAARELDRAAGVRVTYEAATAEDTGLAARSFDLVTVGQAWQWFDRPRAAAEIRRVLRPNGHLVIAQLDWLPLPGTMVEATEELILSVNPRWTLAGGTGLYPEYLTDLAVGGFGQIETFSFDVEVPYSLEAWVGRIRASAGVAATLDEPEVERFSTALERLLTERFGRDQFKVPHRVWAVTARAVGDE